jgi:phosphatidylinositol alpha-1,6-mannosyltransferase
MNLLALITDGFGAAGGIGRYNRDLMTALALSSKVSQVVALPRFGSAGELPRRVVQLPAVEGRLAWIGRAVALGVKQRFDAVFCGHMNAAPLAAMLARATGRPLWLQAHGIEAWESRGAMQRKAVQGARLVTCVSRYTRKRLLEWSDADPARVRVLPNTIHEIGGRRAKPASLLERHGLGGKRVVLTVGRLSAAERYKGHDRVIAALPAVALRVPNVVYLVVGSGDDASRLRQLAADLGVGNRVIFAGQVADAELPGYFQAADVFAMPSTGEGFGIVFLEAAAAGVPVIGCGRDGSRDALAEGRAGTMVDPDNGEALVAALADGLQGRLAGASDVVRRFAFDNFSRHVDELVRTHF